jgi:hypothetical protein
LLSVEAKDNAPEPEEKKNDDNRHDDEPEDDIVPFDGRAVDVGISIRRFNQQGSISAQYNEGGAQLRGVSEEELERKYDEAGDDAELE